MTDSDEALNDRLRALRESDAAVFMEELFKAFYQPLGAVIYRVVPDRAVTEDLLQDVFLRVWQGLDTLPDIASYRAYLTRMGLNAALRYRQRDQRQVAWDEAPLTAAPTAPDALADLHAADTAAAVAAALALLPPQCRLIFELSRYEELSYQQIAEALALSPKTVENQMGKALRILRRELAGVLKNLYALLLYGAVLQLTGNSLPAPRPAPVVTRFFLIFSDRRGGSATFAYPVVVGPPSCRPSFP